MRIFDCSINTTSNKLHNKLSLGSIENDIMKDLRKYSNLFNVEFVDDYKLSDIIITNTSYPDDILEHSIKHNIPKIKRMDGIFNINAIKDRNISLNNAASQSDKVIFISEYSKDVYYKLYGYKLKRECVVLNNVDNIIFKPLNFNKDKFILCSSATNWNRKDKRLKSIINLANRINDKIILIGRCDDKLPSNIQSLGYIEDYNRINTILNAGSLFLSPFFRCAGSKVTIQAIHAGLPVLYSSSGGIKEMVNSGESVRDYTEIDFLDNIPDIDDDDLYNKYIIIKNNYKSYTNFVKKEDYKDTIKKYFDEILSTNI
jgi:glycosyltransferase involved in cell wall biosynthesis